jgi:hypothetical protein
MELAGPRNRLVFASNATRKEFSGSTVRCCSKGPAQGEFLLRLTGAGSSSTGIRQQIARLEPPASRIRPGVSPTTVPLVPRCG